MVVKESITRTSSRSTDTVPTADHLQNFFLKPTIHDNFSAPFSGYNPSKIYRVKVIKSRREWVGVFTFPGYIQGVREETYCTPNQEIVLGFTKKTLLYFNIRIRYSPSSQNEKVHRLVDKDLESTFIHYLCQICIDIFSWLLPSFMTSKVQVLIAIPANLSNTPILE